ncbi:MAG TPA: copper resistance CopC family protein, partial [Roseiflexaceae bacterium]
MRLRYRHVVAFLAAIGLALLLAWPAAAHANLVRSNPAAGATVDQAPPSIELEFSEELDPSFSRAQLFDSQNRQIEPGPGKVDPAAPRVLRLTIPDLQQGSYTVVWRVRSAADGHVTEGSLPFGVGVAAAAASLIPAPGAPDPATLPPPPLDTAARWLNLLAAIGALGGLPFGLLVWRPAFQRWNVPTFQHSNVAAAPLDPCAAADDAMTDILRRLTLVGGLLFLLTNVVFLVAQAAAAAGVPVAQALGAPLLQLL